MTWGVLTKGHLPSPITAGHAGILTTLARDGSPKLFSSSDACLVPILTHPDLFFPFLCFAAHLLLAFCSGLPGRQAVRQAGCCSAGRISHNPRPGHPREMAYTHTHTHTHTHTRSDRFVAVARTVRQSDWRSDMHRVCLDSRGDRGRLTSHLSHLSHLRRSIQSKFPSYPSAFLCGCDYLVVRIQLDATNLLVVPA